MRFITALAVVLVSASMALAEATPVIVAPFAEGDGQQQDWISRSLHQSLVDDMAAMPEVTVLNASKPANPSDAKYIIRPTIQRSNGELRISGRIEEVATGKTIGGFKAGGTERELFAIEDSIASQIGAVLSPRQQQPAVAQQPQQPQAQQPQQPVMVVNGVFEGSDLQRALMDRDYLRRTAIRNSVPDYGMTGGYGYQQPLYPYTVGLGGYPSWYPYGGFGHFWGLPSFPSVIIIRKGHHGGHHGGGHHGGNVILPNNGQAIRHVASWAGRPPSHFVNVPGGTTASNITRPMPMTAGHMPMTVGGGGRR